MGLLPSSCTAGKPGAHLHALVSLWQRSWAAGVSLGPELCCLGRVLWTKRICSSYPPRCVQTNIYSAPMVSKTSPRDTGTSTKALSPMGDSLRPCPPWAPSPGPTRARARLLLQSPQLCPRLAHTGLGETPRPLARVAGPHSSQKGTLSVDGHHVVEGVYEQGSSYSAMLPMPPHENPFIFPKALLAPNNIDKRMICVQVERYAPETAGVLRQGLTKG